MQVCDEILAGQHHDMFPLHVWMTGSGTQFNMNVNEVISNRCCQIAGPRSAARRRCIPTITSTCRSRPTTPSPPRCTSPPRSIRSPLVPAVKALRDAIDAKAKAWEDIVKIGRTHMQDATPLTLGQEWSGYAGMLDDNLERLDGR